MAKVQVFGESRKRERRSPRKSSLPSESRRKASKKESSGAKYVGRPRQQCRNCKLFRVIRRQKEATKEGRKKGEITRSREVANTERGAARSLLACSPSP